MVATQLPSDSAGFPWEGRTFDHHGTAFADDDGSTPEDFRQAVSAVRDAVRALAEESSAAGQAAALTTLAEAHAGAVTTATKCRFLIPLIAEAGDYGETPEGRIVEKSQELSIVTVHAPDGRTALPIFSSTDAMSAWNPRARPIPVPGAQVAIAAAQEETDLVVIDAGDPNTEYVIRRPHLESFALGAHQLPAWADSEVIRSFETSAQSDPRVRSITLAPGDPLGTLAAPETTVGLTLEPGLTRDNLGELLSGLQTVWANDSVITERVDSIAVQVLR